MRAAATLLLAILAAAGLAPSAGAADTCEYVRSAQVTVFLTRVESVDQKCTWYDRGLRAWVTEHLERYDAFGPNGTNLDEPRYELTYFEQAVERRYDDGRTTFEHRTLLTLAEGALVQHDYREARQDGCTTCSGGAELDPPHVPGRLSVPATPQYPHCLPPGLLA